MPRAASGQIVELRRKRGKVFAIRFRAYGQRQYVTLGTTEDGWTRRRAREELDDVLAQVRLGIWQPRAAEPEPPIEEPEPTFHEFASEWLAAREQEGLSPRTIEDYRWALTHHLLPFFQRHKLGEITPREVDRYKAAKAAEGAISVNSINKTLTRLSQVMATAVEYELVAANPAAGRRRRLKGTRPNRPFVEPEQLPALLRASGRNRVLIATLAGAGLRVGEAIELEWRDINLATGVLRVREAKTIAGVREIDLTPSLREELTALKAGTKRAGQNDLAFLTSKGTPQTRQNVRRRVLAPAIKKANKELEELGIEPIGNVSPHGLRRTFASLRAACGDDPVYIAQQIGHEDVAFTLRTYAHAVKRRDRLTGHHRQAFDEALDWAALGTATDLEADALPSLGTGRQRNPSTHGAFASRDGEI